MTSTRKLTAGTCKRPQKRPLVDSWLSPCLQLWKDHLLWGRQWGLTWKVVRSLWKCGTFFEVASENCMELFLFQHLYVQNIGYTVIQLYIKIILFSFLLSSYCYSSISLLSIIISNMIVIMNQNDLDFRICDVLRTSQ